MCALFFRLFSSLYVSIFIVSYIYSRLLCSSHDKHRLEDSYRIRVQTASQPHTSPARMRLQPLCVCRSTHMVFPSASLSPSPSCVHPCLPLFPYQLVPLIRNHSRSAGTFAHARLRSVVNPSIHPSVRLLTHLLSHTHFTELTV